MERVQKSVGDPGERTTPKGPGTALTLKLMVKNSRHCGKTLEIAEPPYKRKGIVDRRTLCQKGLSFREIFRNGARAGVQPTEDSQQRWAFQSFKPVGACGAEKGERGEEEINEVITDRDSGVI